MISSGDAGRTISINHYGASAASLLFEEVRFHSKTVVTAAHESLDASTGTTAPTHPAASGPRGPADVEAHPGVTIS